MDLIQLPPPGHCQLPERVPTSIRAQPFLIDLFKRLSRSLNPVIAVRRRLGVEQPTNNGIDDESSARRAVQRSIALLDVAFSIAETVPLVGGPLKGSLEALCKVLKLVDQKYQNAKGVGKLAERLTALVRALSQYELSDCGMLQLLESLQAIEMQLHRLLSKERLRYTVVAQALADCRNDVNDYLQDFMVLAQVRMLIQSNKPERMAIEFIVVVDPYARRHEIPKLNVCSIEAVAMGILQAYDYNTAMKGALIDFVRVGMYELTMSDGRQITTLTSDVLSSLDEGSTLVMNVVIVVHSEEQGSVRCPTCKETIPSSQEGRAICIPCDGKVSTVKSVESQASPRPQPERPDANISWFRHITIHEVISTAQFLERSLATQADVDDDKSPVLVLHEATQKLFGHGHEYEVQYLHRESDGVTSVDGYVALVRLIPTPLDVLGRMPMNVGLGYGPTRTKAMHNAAGSAFKHLAALYTDDFKLLRLL